MQKLNAVQISTSHITRKDTALLQSFARIQMTDPSQGELLVYMGPYGWFVNWQEKNDAEFFASLQEDGFSEAMRNVLIYARGHGYDWIRFDRDANLTDVLEVANAN